MLKGVEYALILAIRFELKVWVMAQVDVSRNSKDDINLVDLAAKIVRYQRIFYAVFILVFLIGVAYAFFVPAKYEYASLIRVADTRIEGASEPLEAPAETAATIRNESLPEREAGYYAKTGDALRFKVVIITPEDTALIKLTSVAEKADAPLVKSIHEKLLAQVVEHQGQLVNDTSDTLEREIGSLEEVMARLEGKEDTGEVLVQMLERQSALSRQLERLTSAEVIVTARESVNKTSLGGGAIILLTVSVALFLGVFAALFTSFVGSVRAQLGKK